MNLTLGFTFGSPMFSDAPLSFSIDFKPRRIDMLNRPTTWQPIIHLNSLGTSANRCIRCLEVDIYQFKK
ncbi:unknown protein [Desulfotalea psychrophila LSv54]|uniref:Uncharacterized protein n=1 Tax=Desulfotalea psychrophila (strain LSv54 / DSM 12343) TaxID=177439 RepID=Q6AN43_DESPS|nr:unknown protein [Desulfotalea psychrophila LSv54]